MVCELRLGKGKGRFRVMCKISFRFPIIVCVKLSFTERAQVGLSQSSLDCPGDVISGLG
jgi:hypothetical protein